MSIIARDKFNDIAAGILENIGYLSNNIVRNFEFTDFSNVSNPKENISVAAFHREPFSVDTCCISVVDYINLDQISKYKFSGAPRLIASNGIDYHAFKYQVDGFKSVFRGDLSEIRSFLLEDIDKWSPNAVIRLKNVGLNSIETQSDLFDFGMSLEIDAIIEKKLNNLIVSILKSAENNSSYKSGANENFKLLFELIMAKYSFDLYGNSEAYSYASASQFIIARNRDNARLGNDSIGIRMWKKLQEGFSFRNLSPKHLAHIYENALIDDAMRREYGIHATPYALASIIVNSLPIQSLPSDERTIFEPFCGYAPFLLASSDYLRNSLTDEKFSSFDVDTVIEKNLLGADIDDFSIELSKYSLLLANFPRQIAPNIVKSDLLESDNLASLSNKCNIVFCNPPYETIYNKDINKGSKANEAVLRILASKPKMIGLILPRSFVSGNNNKEILLKISKLYNNIHLISLPDSVFKYSKLETVIVLAWNAHAVEKIKITRQYIDRKDYKVFLQSGKTTWSTETLYDKDNVYPFWTHPLIERIVASTVASETLSDIAYISRGLQWKKGIIPEIEDGDTSVAGDGIVNVKKSAWTKYIVKHHMKLKIDPDLMLYSNINREWRREKVITNVHRRSTSTAWVIDAAVDYEGLYIGQAFYGIWPHKSDQLELISAIINSPLVNSLLSLKKLGADITLRSLRDIPIPLISENDAKLVKDLVKEYIASVEYTDKWDIRAFQIAKKSMAKIDAIILHAYNLPEDVIESILHFYISGDIETVLTTSDRVNKHRRILEKYYEGAVSLEDIRVSNYIEWVNKLDRDNNEGINYIFTEYRN